VGNEERQSLGGGGSASYLRIEERALNTGTAKLDGIAVSLE
jgi:hypothetical protein